MLSTRKLRIVTSDPLDTTLQPQVSSDISAWVLQYVIHDLEKVNQSRIAEILDIDASFVSRVLGGKESLSMRRLLQLAKHLDIPLPVLIFRSAKYAPYETSTPKTRVELEKVLDRRFSLLDEPSPLDQALRRLKKRLAQCRQKDRRSRELGRLLRLCEEAINSRHSQQELLIQLCNWTGDHLPQQIKDEPDPRQETRPGFVPKPDSGAKRKYRWMNAMLSTPVKFLAIFSAMSRR